MIIAENEIAYKEKYGESLEENWNSLNKEKQDEAIQFVNPFITAEIESNIEYEKDSLLRILVGYHGKALIENLLKNAMSSVRILVWEPDEAVFLAGCVVENISSFIKDDRITFIFGLRDIGYLRNILKKNLFDYNMNHISLSAISRYSSNDNRFVNDFRKLIIEMACEINFEGNMRKTYGTLPYENYLYAIHALCNNYTIDQLLEQIQGRDIPIILVAAGPSLDKNCTELKTAKGKALIIAVTHAMKTLKKAGVIPDLVAVTDPEKMDFMDFDKEKSYYLLSNVYASKSDQQHYNGKVLYFGFTSYEGLFSTRRINGGIDPELSTGSVSTDVFSLFEKAGFRKFILVGQDLSYDEDGNTHTGNYLEQCYYEKSGLFIKTEGINGGLVKTRFDWDRFRRFFEDRIIRFPNLQVIDATEGGALIHGSKVMNLKDAISEYCIKDYPVCEWLGNISKGNENERDEIKRWFEDEIGKCSRLNNILDEIGSINRSVNEAMLDPSLWNDDFSAACKRYDVLYRVIMEGNDGELLRLYCRKEVQEYLENALTYEGDENLEKRMNLEHNFFSILNKMSRDLIEYMRKLQDDIV